jgi:hypothetical protein
MEFRLESLAQIVILEEKMKGALSWLHEEIPEDPYYDHGKAHSKMNIQFCPLMLSVMDRT